MLKEIRAADRGSAAFLPADFSSLAEVPKLYETGQHTTAPSNQSKPKPHPQPDSVMPSGSAVNAMSPHSPGQAFPEEMQAMSLAAGMHYHRSKQRRYGRRHPFSPTKVKVERTGGPD